MFIAAFAVIVVPKHKVSARARTNSLFFKFESSFYHNIMLPFIENHGNIFVADVFEKHTKGKRKKCNRYIPLSKTAEDLFRMEYEL
ncbi:MAG TPA: hypothetical protein DEW33_06090 [Lachnospiraceae bacterium]|nr:hypothetical protein [Lachnospiraceae bacterium]